MCETDEDAAIWKEILKEFENCEELNELMKEELENDEEESLHAGSNVSADNNEGCSVASQETVENNQPCIESKKEYDPERDKLLALLEGDEEPETSIEDKLKKLYEESEKEGYSVASQETVENNQTTKEVGVNSKESKENNTNSVSNLSVSSNEVVVLNTDILHPRVDELIDLTDEQKIVTIKIKKVEPVIVIEDDLYIKTEKIDVKLEPNTTDEVPIKKEKQDEFSSLCHSNVEPDESKVIFGNDTEEGEVIDCESEILERNIVKIKEEPDPDSLTNPTSSNVVAAGFGVKGNNESLALCALMTKNISLAMKLTKYVKHHSKKKSRKKKSKKKSKSKRSRRSRRHSSSSRSRSQSSSTSRSSFSSRSRSRSKPRINSRSRSRSKLRFNSRSRSQSRSRSGSFKKMKFKKTYRPKELKPRSPSRSPSRRSPSPYKRNYQTTNNRSRINSRSHSKSPQRKKPHFNSFKPRSYSRSPSLSKTLVYKKDNWKRSPSESPRRRKRKYSVSSSSSDSSSSSTRYKRRRRCRSRSRSRSRSRPRSRSRTPKKSSTLPRESKTMTSTSVSSDFVNNFPSTSQQTFVSKHTYQQQIRQGNNVMTRQATVTTSFKQELKSFKKSLVKGSSNNKNDEDIELNKLELTVFDEKEKDVTKNRPDGDLNHPFYIHPEDAELYQMKCRNGLQPLQALHELCVKCQWLLPKYLLLPTPKGFRFGMEIKGFRFVSEKTAQQKKLAKAAAALTVLQWMKIVDN